jgi:hypothetical protein
MGADKELLSNIASVVAEDRQLPDNQLFKDKAPEPEKKEPKEKEVDPEPNNESLETEEKSPAEEKVKPSEDDKSKDGDFSAELKQRALDIGLSEEDVKTFPSEEALDKALILIEKRGIASQPKQEETPPAVAPEVKKEEKASEKDAEEDIPDLDPEVFDEKLVEVWGALKGVNKKQAEIIEQLKGQVATLTQQSLASHKDRLLDQVEDFFGDLGEEYTSFIGKGRGSDLQKDSVEMKARVEILEVAESLMENYARQKKNVPFKTALARATHAILGDKLRDIESGKIASKLEKRSKAFMPKPGGLNEKASTEGRSPEELAEVAVKKILEKAQK